MGHYINFIIAWDFYKDCNSNFYQEFLNFQHNFGGIKFPICLLCIF